MLSFNLRANIERNTYFLLASFIVAVFLWVLYASHNLRPAGDDYCFGAITAEHGFIGGVIQWWNVWSGFLFAMTSSSLFVGLPLTFLPFNLASAITFICAGLGMGLTMWAINRAHVTDLDQPLTKIIFFAISWWVYFWTEPAIHLNINNDFANGLTFWQTLNGQYVIPLQMLIIILAFNWPLIRDPNHCKFYLVILPLGILAGTAGTALSLAFLVAGIVLGVWTIFKYKVINRVTCFWFLLCAFVLAATLICHFFSPGSIARESAIHPSYDLSGMRPLLIIKSTILEGFRIWIRSYVNYGALVCFVLTAGLFYFSSSGEKVKGSKKALWISVGLALFSLLQCFVNRLSEEFTYSGYWHYLDAKMCTFLSISLVGLWCGSAIKKYCKHLFFRMFLLVVFCISIYVSFRAIDFMVDRIEWRGNAWSKGSAVVDGISDIGSQGKFEMECWNRLNKLRKTPLVRGNAI